MNNAEKTLIVILLLAIGIIAYNWQKITCTRAEFDTLAQNVYRIEDRLKNFKDDKGNRLTLEEVLSALFSKYNEGK